MNFEFETTSVQQDAADALWMRLAASPVCVISGPEGSGKTAVLHALAAQSGGVYLGTSQLRGARLVQGPAALEEAFFRMLEEAIEEAGVVLVDDLDPIVQAAEAGGPGRVHRFEAGLTAILALARGLGRKVVFATRESIPRPIRRRAQVIHLGAASPAN